MNAILSNMPNRIKVDQLSHHKSPPDTFSVFLCEVWYFASLNFFLTHYPTDNSTPLTLLFGVEIRQSMSVW